MNKKHISFLLILLVVFVGIISLVNVQAQTSVQGSTALSGWAWSSNIGWISMGSSTAGSGGGNYGVYAGPTGTLDGYAWSSNVGWVSFKSVDVTGCGSQAVVSTSTGDVTGWAKVLSGSQPDPGTGLDDGWDGCIELSGTNHGTRNINAVLGTALSNTGLTVTTATGATIQKGTISGYSWGDEVLGWAIWNTLLPSVAGPQLYSLTTISSPTAGGTTSGGGSYLSGASVTLGANPSVGYRFTEWRNGATQISTNPTHLFTMPSTNVTLTAYFVTCTTGEPGCNPGTSYDMNVIVINQPGGSGNVTGPQIDCGSDCTGSYTTGTTVTLNAIQTAGPSYTWSGCDSTVGGSCTVTMNADKTVTITFNGDIVAPSAPTVLLRKTGGSYSRLTEITIGDTYDIRWIVPSASGYTSCSSNVSTNASVGLPSSADWDNKTSAQLLAAGDSGSTILNNGTDDAARGEYTFSLTCSNATGPGPTGSATLQIKDSDIIED